MSLVIGLRLGCSATDTWNESQSRIDTQHTEIVTVLMTNGSGLSGGLWEGARENTVANVLGVPKIGEQSSILPGAYCVSRSFNEVGPATWEIECVYDNTQKRAVDVTASNEPWDLDPTWSWSFENMDVPLLYDADDPARAIRNSAGESLPPLTTTIAIPVLTIKRFEVGFTHGIITSYVNKRNESAFWGIAEDKVLCAGIKADPEKKDNFKYWSVEYIFKFNTLSDGWAVRLLDEGTYYWEGGVGTGTKKPFGDDAFQQVIGNLDGSGGKNTDPNTPQFTEPFQRYPKAEFNDLNLGPWTW